MYKPIFFINMGPIWPIWAPGLQYAYVFFKQCTPVYQMRDIYEICLYKPIKLDKACASMPFTRKKDMGRFWPRGR